MEKLNLSTSNITSENVEKIAELFPDAVTESSDSDGNVVRSIDFDALKADLSDDIVDGGRERYRFTWPGKRAAKLEAREPFDGTLRPCREKSVDWDSTQNVYIEGDNLQALKLMRETYAGKVKLIYIDPPYNTGHDFIYDDDFSRTRADYDAESGDFDEEGGRLVANPESNGRFHSDWCSMMYPRLLLGRDLLSDDGAIFISIDDVEQRNLRCIADEIFGAECFVGTIVWNKRVPKNDNKGIGNIHEYVLVYSKQVLNYQLAMRKTGLDDIQEFVDVLKQKHIPISESEKKLKAFYKEKGYDRAITLYNNLDDDYRLWGKINMSWPNANTFGPRYEVLHPITKKPVKVPDRGWRWKKETFDAALGDESYRVRYDGSVICGSVWFAQDETTQPSSIKYLDDVSNMLLRSILSYKSDGGIEVEHLFDGKSFFSYPKPTGLLEVLFNSVQDRDGIYMDFFSGSATSAETVMRMNLQDNGQRRMVSVQIPEPIETESAAGKAGYETLTALGEERIRRAGAKIVSEVEESNRQLKLGEKPKPVPDVGFRVFRIDSSNFRETYREPGEVDQSSIFDYVDNLKIDRTPEDLLFQVLPKFRIPYSAKVEEREVCGKRVFFVEDGQLVACFDTGVGTDTIEAIAKTKPLYAVFRDASLADDATEANFEELFKTYSPDTIRRVI